MQKLILQLYNAAQWHDAAELCFYDVNLSAKVTISYTHAYLANSPSYELIDNEARIKQMGLLND